MGTPWRMYGFTVVSMGDTPASCFMELTRKRTASMGGNLDPPAAERIKKDAFVDDITTGGSDIMQCVYHIWPSPCYTQLTQKLFF